MALDTETVVYVAAVLDVQGRIRTMETHGGTALPYVSLSTPNHELLGHLGELTGTTPFITTRTYDKHRCSIHCTERHDHVTSVSGRWSVNGARATILLAAILPYLRFQKTDAEEALAVGLAAPRKSATQQKMQSLGWPLPEDW